MKTIYTPSGRAKEYAALAINIYNGCDHGCEYCFAPSVLFRDRQDFYNHPQERVGLLDALEKYLLKNPGHQERVLLCFTCDPYQAIDERLQITRSVIGMLHAANYSIEVLTKGGKRALRDLDKFHPLHDKFATTLTLIDDAQSKQWEPNAESPSDRIATLKEFHAAGIETWVSLEPVLDPVQALKIIQATADFVDLYKIGKLNYHAHAKTIDWAEFASQAVEFLEILQKPYYIKKDLLEYLPTEKRNEKYRQEP